MELHKWFESKHPNPSARDVGVPSGELACTFLKTLYTTWLTLCLPAAERLGLRGGRAARGSSPGEAAGPPGLARGSRPRPGEPTPAWHGGADPGAGTGGAGPGLARALAQGEPTRRPRPGGAEPGAPHLPRRTAPREPAWRPLSSGRSSAGRARGAGRRDSEGAGRPHWCRALSLRGPAPVEGARSRRWDGHFQSDGLGRSGSRPRVGVHRAAPRGEQGDGAAPRGAGCECRGAHRVWAGASALRAVHAQSLWPPSSVSTSVLGQLGAVRASSRLLSGGRSADPPDSCRLRKLEGQRSSTCAARAPPGWPWWGLARESEAAVEVGGSGGADVWLKVPTASGVSVPASHTPSLSMQMPHTASQRGAGTPNTPV